MFWIFPQLGLPKGVLTVYQSNRSADAACPRPGFPEGTAPPGFPGPPEPGSPPQSEKSKMSKKSKMSNTSIFFFARSSPQSEKSKMSKKIQNVKKTSIFFLRCARSQMLNMSNVKCQKC